MYYVDVKHEGFSGNFIELEVRPKRPNQFKIKQTKRHNTVSGSGLRRKVNYGGFFQVREGSLCQRRVLDEDSKVESSLRLI